MQESTSVTKLLADAERFLQHSGRLLERLRFEHVFRDRRAEAATRVLAALRPYQNADGGFGQILEPDFRGPVSQPLCVDQAFRVLDELALPAMFSDAVAVQALGYLSAISAPDGGVPNVLLTAGSYPRAPWWFRVARHWRKAHRVIRMPERSLLAHAVLREADHDWLARRDLPLDRFDLLYGLDVNGRAVREDQAHGIAKVASCFPPQSYRRLARCLTDRLSARRMAMGLSMRNERCPPSVKRSRIICSPVSGASPRSYQSVLAVSAVWLVRPFGAGNASDAATNDMMIS